MFRTFTLQVPVTTFTNLWTMLQTDGFIDSLGNELVSGVKNGAILPDRVAEFDVRPCDAATGTIKYRDQQADPGTEQALTNMSKRSNRNSICLKDYLFNASVDANTEQLVLEIEAI